MNPQSPPSVGAHNARPPTLLCRQLRRRPSLDAQKNHGFCRVFTCFHHQNGDFNHQKWRVKHLKIGNHLNMGIFNHPHWGVDQESGSLFHSDFFQNRQFGTDVAQVFGDFPVNVFICFYGLVVFLLEFWWFYSCFLWFQCAKTQYSDGIYVTQRSPQEFFSSCFLGNRLGEILNFWPGWISDPKLTSAMLIKYSVHMYISDWWFGTCLWLSIQLGMS